MRIFCGSVTAILLSTTGLCAEPLSVTVNRGTVLSVAPSVAEAQAYVATIPGGASVVDSKSFENEYVLNFKDMLSSTPGVFAQPRFGEEVRLSIRGSGVSRGFHLRGINLLQDGIPFNLADGSGDFQEIDPLILQHIEIYRGANALQYGATTLGGAINMVTPGARNIPYNYLYRMEGGSYGTLRLHAATAQVIGNADAYVAGTKSLAGGYRAQSEQDNQRLYGNIGLKLSERAETRLYMMYNDIQQEVPGTLTRDDAIFNPEKAPPINRLNDYARDIRSTRIASKTAIQLDAAHRLDFGGYINTKQLLHPIFEVIDQDSTDFGGFFRLDGKTRSFGSHDYTFGLTASAGKTDALRFVNVRGNRGNMTADADQTAKNWTLYGENSWYIRPNLALVAGGQAYFSKRELDNILAPSNNADKSYSGFNPKLGMLWHILPTAQVYANVSRSAEVPTFSELVQFPVTGFVPLDEQSAWTWEIGTRGDSGTWSWDVSAYHANVNGELLQFSTNASIPAATFNADNTVHQGLELGAAYRFSDRLQTSLVYNFSNFHFDGDAQFGDNTLPVIPRHVLTAQLDYTALPGWTVSPHAEWIPTGAYVDFANTLDAPGYATVGVKSDYRLNENVSFFADARNLTNEATITNFSTVTNARTAATNVFYPGEGRSVYAGFTVKF